MESTPQTTLSTDPARGEAMTVRNLTRGTIMHASPMPSIMLGILDAGGLVGFLSKFGGWDVPDRS